MAHQQAYDRAYAARRAEETPGTTDATCRRHVEAFLRDAQNLNTSAAYASGMRDWRRWVRTVANPMRAPHERIDEERPHEHQVAAYMQHLHAARGLALSTINSRVSAIHDSLRYRVTDAYHPTEGRYITQMRAVLTPLAKPATQKREITRAQLVRILRAAHDDGTHLAQRDACMLLLAFSTLLRTSEVVRMNRGDITFTHERIDGAACTVMRVWVDRMAKNDKRRTGHERLVRQTSGEHDLPRMMRAFLQQGDTRDVASPLFPTQRGGRMATSTPGGRLTAWFKTIGVLDARAYGFHSMRAGGASHAARCGVAVRHIKQMGNWQSDAVNVYVRADMQDRLRASDATSRDE